MFKIPVYSGEVGVLPQLQVGHENIMDILHGYPGTSRIKQFAEVPVDGQRLIPNHLVRPHLIHVQSLILN